MRCDQCNKWASFDSDVEPEVDVQFSFNEELDILASGSVRIVNQCAECGQELTEATFDVDETVTVEHAEGCEAKADDDPSYEDPGGERFDEYQPPGRPLRYSKHMYGAKVECEVGCESCGAKAIFSWEDSIQSSGMDPLI